MGMYFRKSSSSQSSALSIGTSELKKDTVVIVATGGGKTLIYIMAALMTENKVRYP